jgi:hypothetical protein
VQAVLQSKNSSETWLHRQFPKVPSDVFGAYEKSDSISEPTIGSAPPPHRSGPFGPPCHYNSIQRTRESRWVFRREWRAQLEISSIQCQNWGNRVGEIQWRTGTTSPVSMAAAPDPLRAEQSNT